MSVSHPCGLYEGLLSSFQESAAFKQQGNKFKRFGCSYDSESLKRNLSATLNYIFPAGAQPEFPYDSDFRCKWGLDVRVASLVVRDKELSITYAVFNDKNEDVMSQWEEKWGRDERGAYISLEQAIIETPHIGKYNLRHFILEGPQKMMQGIGSIRMECRSEGSHGVVGEHVGARVWTLAGVEAEDIGKVKKSFFVFCDTNKIPVSKELSERVNSIDHMYEFYSLSDGHPHYLKMDTSYYLLNCKSETGRLCQVPFNLGQSFLYDLEASFDGIMIPDPCDVPHAGSSDARWFSYAREQLQKARRKETTDHRDWNNFPLHFLAAHVAGKA